MLVLLWHLQGRRTLHTEAYSVLLKSSLVYHPALLNLSNRLNFFTHFNCAHRIPRSRSKSHVHNIRVAQTHSLQNGQRQAYQQGSLHISITARSQTQLSLLTNALLPFRSTKTSKRRPSPASPSTYPMNQTSPSGTSPSPAPPQPLMPTANSASKSSCPRRTPSPPPKSPSLPASTTPTSPAIPRATSALASSSPTSGSPRPRWLPSWPPCVSCSSSRTRMTRSRRGLQRSIPRRGQSLTSKLPSIQRSMLRLLIRLLEHPDGKGPVGGGAGIGLE